MDDLIRVAAENKIIGSLQAPENELKLNVRNILHFIDNHKIIDLFYLRQIAVRKDIRVVKAVLLQESQVFFKQRICPFTLIGKKDGLPDPEAKIFFAGKPRFVHDGPGQHTPELLVEAMNVGDALLL